jgi:hypothetical protein
MLLDRKTVVLENLDTMKRSYMKLTLLKEREREAQEGDDYEFLYELSENERVLIEGINDCLKCIVPDLLALREDETIRTLLAEIDELHGIVISESIRIRRDLRRSMVETEEKLRSLKVFPGSSHTPPPHILNIRA